MNSFSKRVLQSIATTLVVFSSACKPAAAATSDDVLFQNLTDFGYGIYLQETGFFKQANARMSELLKRLDKEPVQSCSKFIPLLRTDTKCGDLQKQLYAEALEIRALSRFHLKQQSAALADLKRALALCPEHAHLHNTIGRLYLRMKRSKEGLDEIDRALSLNANIPDAYLAKAAYYQDHGQRIESQKFLTKGKTLLAARQKLLDSLWEKIEKLQESKRTDEALAADVELLTEFPRDVFALKNYSENLSAVGKHQEALNYANVAVLLDPTFAGGYRVRSKIYALLKKTDLELADATRAFLMEPRSAEALNARAIANLDTDRPFEAIRDFDLLIQLNPDYVDAYINRSAALSRVGRFDDSIKDARKAYALAPSSPYGYQALGAALRRARRFPEAKKALDESFRYKSSASPDSLAMAEFNLGATLKELGDQTANNHLDEAIRLAPDLALILLKNGTYDARKTAPDRGVRVLTRQLRNKASTSKLTTVSTKRPLSTPRNASSSETLPVSKPSSPVVPASTSLPRSRKTNNLVAKTTATGDAKYQRLNVYDLLDCIVAATRQIEREPDKSKPYFIRGVAYFCLGKFEDAAKDLERYDEIAPDGGGTGATLAQLAKYRSENASHPHLPPLKPSDLRDLIRRTEAQLVSSSNQVSKPGKSLKTQQYP